jgi:hypothetical protein
LLGDTVFQAGRTAGVLRHHAAVHPAKDLGPAGKRACFAKLTNPKTTPGSTVAFSWSC